MELCGSSNSSSGACEKPRSSSDGAVPGKKEVHADIRVDNAAVLLPAATLAAPPLSAPSSAPSSSSSFRKFRNLLMAKKFEAHDNLPIQVLPEGLFIGSFGAASNLSALQQLGISHILCVSGSLALQFPESFEYLRLSIADLPTVRIADAFPAAFAFINRAISGGGKVLVHCYLGKSRSATIILAFLIVNKRMNLSDAMAFLRHTRPQAQPNSGFLVELQQFEMQQQQQLEQLVLNEPERTPGARITAVGRLNL